MADPKRYRITVPCLTCRVEGQIMAGARAGGGGWTLLTYYRDAWLPTGAHPEDIARHLAAGRIEEVA